MVLALAFLLWNLVRAALLNQMFSSVTLVIPGVTLRLYWLPYFLIAVILTIFIHEAAHGIVAINEGISVKSAGILLLAFFLGGFIEPDEKELSVASSKAKMKVFSAGSSSNIVAGLIVFLLLSSLFIQIPSGLIVLETLDGGPLYRTGIGFWDVIYAINGHEIHTLQDLRDFMSNVKPGEEIIISTSKGNFVIAAAPSPEGEEHAIVGLVSSIPYYPSKLGLGHPIDTHLYLALNWLFIVLMSVAAFNMLPIPYLDGDKIFQCLAEKFLKEGSILKRFFNLLSLFLLLANIVISSV
ncbi:MAG: M50 family metallopeptidase [Candidatus Bathyarchaeia archaeon]